MKLMESTILNNYDNYLNQNNLMALGEKNAEIIFKSCIHSLMKFLKFSKHNAEHTVIKALDLDGTFICAMEVSLESDEDGNKNWALGLVFEEDDLEITDKTKVFTTNDSVYITSYKSNMTNCWGVSEISVPEKIHVSSVYPLLLLKKWGETYFEIHKKEDTVELVIDDVVSVTYTKESNDTVSISASLHQTLKQDVKSDGNVASNE